ncbi:hypothetical protein JCM8547_000745 [Rhodosporidiobolus lusitaniae]
MALSTLDLVSKLAGYESFAASLWSAMPQIYLLWKTKPGYGGPIFSLLLCWLVGDLLQMAGLFLLDDILITQQISAIVFAVTDIVIMGQLLFYRGWVLGTQRWKQRKQHRLPAPLRVEITRWKNVNGTPVNLTALAVLTIACLAVWVALDVVQRKDKSALVPASPPHDFLTHFGWWSGWAGTAFYQLPRLPQLWQAWRKGTDSISPWLFAFLVLQNVTMAISILTVSHTASAMYGQLPYICNVFIALGCDLTYLGIHFYHRKHPVMHKLVGWEEPHPHEKTAPLRRYKDPHRTALLQQYRHHLSDETEHLSPHPFRLPPSHMELDAHEEREDRLHRRMENDALGFENDEGASEREKEGRRREHDQFEEETEGLKRELREKRAARRERYEREEQERRGEGGRRMSAAHALVPMRRTRATSTAVRSARDSEQTSGSGLGTLDAAWERGEG